MAHITNSIERFWQELKRRKVVHVITVYAAVAFVIMQVVDIVAEPLRLPVSTKALVIVLLCIGFVIAVFVSWIYDITPAGVKKTKPTSPSKHVDQTDQVGSGRWKITTYVSLVFIMALIAFNFLGRKNRNTEISKLEKSIAVLPFRNDSSNDSTMYFINGLMEKILNNLQMIKELRVISRTSVEQYRNTNKTIPEIAKEQDVNYIVEGSGQKYGNTFSINIQLIKAAKENHLWGKSFEKEIKEIRDITSVQSEIAQSIAAELKARITPEEKQLIDKIPTTNLTAYDFYQRGREEHTKYWIDNNNREALEKADDLYHKALKCDSTYANAYVGLAMTNLDKHIWESYLSKNLMDSVLILCDRAIYYDKQLSDAYTVKGDYYRALNKTDQASEEYDKAIKINPNDFWAYIGKALLSTDYDWGMAIYNANKAISIYRGPLLSYYLHGIGQAYFSIGFMEKAKNCFEEALKLDGDSVQFYNDLSTIEFGLENYENANNYLKKANAIDTSNANILWELGQNYLFLGQYKESLIYFKKWLQKSSTLSEKTLFATHRIGWAYKQNGYEKEAGKYFNEQIKYCNKMIDLGRGTYREYYDLAGVYASLGEKGKAYKNLQIYNQKNYVWKWMVSAIKIDTEFNSIRNEPQFQQIVRDMEAKYQVEHERVKKWLEEQGML